MVYAELHMRGDGISKSEVEVSIRCHMNDGCVSKICILLMFQFGSIFVDLCMDNGIKKLYVYEYSA